jgi:hypothetical protein
LVFKVQLRFPCALSRRASTLTALGLGAALLGCGDVQESGAVGREQSGVIGGVTSGSEHDGVVQVFSSNNSCSGSLIAPNLVLTALHCLVEQSTDAFTCNTDGTAAMGGDLGALRPPSDFTIFVGKAGVGGGSTAKASGKQLFSTGSMNACKWDLGLVLLDQDVDAPLVPLRFATPTEPGEETTVIGYGLTAGGAVQGRQERDNVNVLYVGADLWNKGSQFASPDTIVVGQGPCHGDSGAPLLSMETGAAIGVSSVIFSSCEGAGAQSAYTEVASFESTIRMALDAAGHEPVLEQTGSGGGNAGAPGQAGEAGALGEGGAVTGSGGGGALGGTGGGGGSGDTAALAGKGGTSGSAGQSAAGTGASAGNSTSDGGTSTFDGGSGSRRDPSCTCRTAGRDRSSRSFAAIVVGALALVLRRRSRVV